MSTIAKVIVALTLVISSCSAYKVVLSEKSGADKPYLFVGKNNYLASRQGRGGVYLDPFMKVERSTKKALLTGFHLRFADEGTKAALSPVRSVVFVLDGKDRMPLEIYGQSPDSQDGIAALSRARFDRVCTAGAVDVKIVGKQGTHSYGTDVGNAGFLANLRKFRAFIAENPK